jgi:hypothetical protein
MTRAFSVAIAQICILFLTPGPQAMYALDHCHTAALRQAFAGLNKKARLKGRAF